MNIEDIQFEKSETLERFLLDWGRVLCESTRGANSVNDLTAIRSAVTEFSVLASAYSESTNGFREDLGVNLGEAVDLKLNMIKNQKENKEWEFYLRDTEAALGELENERKL